MPMETAFTTSETMIPIRAINMNRPKTREVALGHGAEDGRDAEHRRRAGERQRRPTPHV